MRDEITAQEKARGWRKSPHRARFWILIAVGAIVAVCVLAIVVDAAVYYNKIHAGVTIAGQSVSGLTRDEATTQIAELVEEAQRNGVVLKSDAKTWTVMPTDVGAKMDVAGAVSAAMDVSRKGNFFVDLGRHLKLYFSDVDVTIPGTVDSAMMDKVLAGVAEEIDVLPIDAGLAIEGAEIKVIEGQNGLIVDQDTLRERLKVTMLTLHSTELTVPMIVAEPDVQAEDNREAQEQAETMISSSVTLKDAENTWTITPVQIASYMDFTSEDQNGVSKLVPYLSAAKMDVFFTSIADKVATKPVDASFDSDGTKAWVIPAVLGKELDREETAKTINAAALETTGRSAAVVVKTTEPDLTTEEANAMGIKDLLASYTTPPYEGTANRQVNVRITTQYASNVMLAPGEDYNFDEQIGPRIAARGYKLAKGIVGNGVLEDVLGGGICQVSTTLFNAVFEAGLKVLERHNHSLYIDHYPPGRDATVTGGGKNFRFMNDTDHYIWIKGRSDGVTTTFNIYGTDDGRKVKASFSGFSYGPSRTQVTVLQPSLPAGTTVVSISGQQGRSCSVKRTITYADGTTHTDKFVSNYPMIPRTVLVGPSTTTTTVPTTTTTTEETTTTSSPPVTS